jgi:hypothetical protein
VRPKYRETPATDGSPSKTNPGLLEPSRLEARHLAMLRARSNDLLVLSRLALQAAIRTERDLLNLLEPPAKSTPASHETAHVTCHAQLT